jgi:hypothetical protein
MTFRDIGRVFCGRATGEKNRASLDLLHVPVNPVSEEILSLLTQECAKLVKDSR